MRPMRRSWRSPAPTARSTTTALIAHLMRVAGYDTQMGGNIGTAILSLEPPRMGRVHVIEMSSYQIDLAPSLDPSVGILLNISEDHIDRHGTFEHYAAVKERLVAGVQPQGAAIVGVDDGWSRNIADRLEQSGKRVIRVSVKNPLADGIYVERETILRASGGARTEIAKIGGIGSLRGLHNAQNAACASACALTSGLSTDVLQNGLRSFPGLAHRMEQVGRRGNVLFVNDSKGTNADAAAHALVVLCRHLLDRRRQAETRRYHQSDRIFSAHPQGLSDRRSRRRIRRHPGRSRPARNQRHARRRSSANAARDAEASGIADPVVLLSPACASFDQYRNFEIRGAKFRDLVTAMPGVKPVV